MDLWTYYNINASPESLDVWGSQLFTSQLPFTFHDSLGSFRAFWEGGKLDAAPILRHIAQCTYPIPSHQSELSFSSFLLKDEAVCGSGGRRGRAVMAGGLNPEKQFSEPVSPYGFFVFPFDWRPSFISSQSRSADGPSLHGKAIPFPSIIAKHTDHTTTLSFNPSYPKYHLPVFNLPLRGNLGYRRWTIQYADHCFHRFGIIYSFRIYYLTFLNKIESVDPEKNGGKIGFRTIWQRIKKMYAILMDSLLFF